MYNIIALIGESGSGKDTMLKEFLIQYPQCNKIITSTSRSPREHEIEGIHYHFYSDEEFIRKIQNDEMIEWSIFNNWQYGTSFDALSKDSLNIGVFNPAAIRQLLKNNKCNIKVFWVRTTPKERLLRQLLREEDPNVYEIVRRAKADFEDFEKIDFEYIIIPNNNSTELLAGPKAIMRSFETESALGQN